MNKYVNKQNAEGLKRIGFDELCICFYEVDGEFKINQWPFNNKQNLEYFAAPDFLTAADWLWEKHEVNVEFLFKKTTVKSIYKKEIIAVSFSRDDHRNSAIAKAISIIEERRGK